MGFLYTLLANPAVFAQAKETTQKSSGLQQYGIFIIIGVMLLVFYFLIIVPQRKRAREMESLLSKIQVGDEVVTIGGVHGTVNELLEDKVVIEVDEGVNMTFSRAAIARNTTVHEEPDEEEAEEEEEPAEGTEEEPAGEPEETEGSSGEEAGGPEGGEKGGK
ncbi:MAG: preprotein translocase subunit YajC [Actinobacteria bacterium]|nr:preprotein translocase subunit YajC [Actinomycetota bacterium]MBU1942104.1 preprotein translocase subunit YajC [Actinomycetota bacterium]MBU2687365.1 preprotein translocase subunit YajC [Actinomycetota bacterium]